MAPTVGSSTTYTTTETNERRYKVPLMALDFTDNYIFLAEGHGGVTNNTYLPENGYDYF